MPLLIKMNNINKHFPYPFLSSYSDDYNNTKFEVTINPKKTEIGWDFIFNINLEDMALKNAIKDKKAFYHLVLNCPTTGFRNIEKSFETDKEINISIPKKGVKNEITIDIFIVVNEDFTLSSSNFHRDFGGEVFQVNKFEILGEVDQIVFEEPEIIDPFEPVRSIITIQKQHVDDQKDHVYCGLLGDNIVIYLNDDDFKNYRSLKGSHEDSVLISMLLIPGLMQAINEIVNDDSTYNQLKWYKKLTHKIDEIDNGFYKERDKSDWDIFEISQKILGNQIGIAMVDRFNNLNEDEL